MSSAIQIPRTNLIIGGNFDTNPWQRGTSFAGLTGGNDATYTADKFIFNIQAAATSVVTISKTADAPTVVQNGFLNTNCLKILATTGQASPAAGDYTTIGYRMEGYDFTQIAQQSFTVSFWVKATVTGVYCLSLVNSGNNRSYVAQYTISTTATWEYKTLTITASPSAGTWNYTNGVGLYFYWSLCVGSTYNVGVDGTWTSNLALGTGSQVNALASTNNIFELSLVQCRAGTQQQPWDVRTEQQELALCQRYYWKTFNQATAPAQGVGVNTGECTGAVGSPGATLNSIHVQFPVTMRTAPTITTYSPGAASAQVYNITAAAVHTNTAVGAEGARGIYVTSTGNAGGTIVQVQGVHLAATADI